MAVGGIRTADEFFVIEANRADRPRGSDSRAMSRAVTRSKPHDRDMARDPRFVDRTSSRRVSRRGRNAGGSRLNPDERRERLRTTNKHRAESVMFLRTSALRSAFHAGWSRRMICLSKSSRSCRPARCAEKCGDISASHLTRVERHCAREVSTRPPESTKRSPFGAPDSHAGLGQPRSWFCRRVLRAEGVTNGTAPGFHALPPAAAG